MTLLAAALAAGGVAGGRMAAMVPFLLAVLLIALVWGRGPAAVAALASAAAYNYFLGLDPRHLFSPPIEEDALLLVGLLAVALGLGTLTDRMRVAVRQAYDSAASERFEKALLNCISHDLRTPLTAIIGSLSTLLEEGPLREGARRELLMIAYTGAQQLNRLVGQVLEMTRLESRLTDVRREPAAVAGVVEAACAHLRKALDGRRCRIDVPDALPPVPMDPVLLSHALMNVLDNAVKYSPPGTPIDVRAGLERDVVVLDVADRGPGVPTDQLDRIFEKFYRLHSPTGETAQGSGLGLAIAKEIVEAHGGRIRAQSRPGGGTVVKLSLPVR